MHVTCKFLILSIASALLVACSSDSSNPRADSAGNTTEVMSPVNPEAEQAGSGLPVADNSAGDISGTQFPSEDGTTGDYGDLPSPVIPPIDLLAAPVPGPDLSDPFGSLLETDNEIAISGGAPTQPKNLRIDLVSNDWAEFSWAPANDDSTVVEYRIYRSDGHTYYVRQDQTDSVSGTQAEIDKFWATTSFIDCNYTRFLDRLHNCADHRPKPGDIFSYQVTAVDDSGQESAPSNTITINYHKERGAAVPLYEDPYLDSSQFAQTHDLTNTAYFIDKFELVFEDNFDGNTIDSTKWNTELLWGAEEIINGEQQFFVNTFEQPDFGYDPFRLANSVLSIEAIVTPVEMRTRLPSVCTEPDPFGKARCAFLSGALSSHDRFNLTYGYVEGRMRTSEISGALSSFYLYHRYAGEGVNRHAPEIDIIEYLGENPFGDEDAFQTYHYADVNTGLIRSSPTMLYKNPAGVRYSQDFHTYGVLWEPQLVVWYIDGKEIKRLTGPQVSRQAMNIVTYLVAGSGWAPTPDIASGPFPLRLDIDYIRAYQRSAYKGNGLYP